MSLPDMHSTLIAEQLPMRYGCAMDLATRISNHHKILRKVRFSAAISRKHVVEAALSPPTPVPPKAWKKIDHSSYFNPAQVALRKTH
jgi:hypothetical protein